MRKIVGWLLLALGGFLVALAVLMLFWVPGMFEKVPLSVTTKTYLSGQGQKYQAATGEMLNTPVKVTSDTRVDPDKSDKTNASWVNTTCVVADTGNPPECVDKSDPRLFHAIDDVFVTNRHTGEAIGDEAKKYIGARSDGRSGLVNKWPFHAQKKSYQYWEGPLDRPVTAEYQGTEEISGLEVYKYRMLTTDAPATIVADTQGLYSMDRTVYVEPTTGAIINQVQHEVRKLPDGKKVLDLALEFTPDQIAKNVDEGKSNARKISLLTGPVKWLVLLAGLALVAIGALLQLGGGGLRTRGSDRPGGGDSVRAEDRLGPHAGAGTGPNLTKS